VFTNSLYPGFIYDLPCYNDFHQRITPPDQARENDSMPFRDHFRPPVSKRHSWEEVHGGWPMMIVQKLAPMLPEGYQAAPQVHLGSYFEVDVGTFETGDVPPSRPQLVGDGGVATLPEAELSLETDSTDVSDL
jgi:hypothetical protein